MHAIVIMVEEKPSVNDLREIKNQLGTSAMTHFSLDVPEHSTYQFIPLGSSGLQTAIEQVYGSFESMFAGEQSMMIEPQGICPYIRMLARAGDAILPAVNWWPKDPEQPVLDAWEDLILEQSFKIPVGLEGEQLKIAALNHWNGILQRFVQSIGEQYPQISHPMSIRVPLVNQ